MPKLLKMKRKPMRRAPRREKLSRPYATNYYDDFAIDAPRVSQGTCSSEVNAKANILTALGAKETHVRATIVDRYTDAVLWTYVREKSGIDWSYGSAAQLRTLRRTA